MSDYDEAVKKGAIYVPGYNPPGGTVAAEQKRRQEVAQQKKYSTGGGGGGGNSGGCFIATATYGDYNSPEVLFLRNFRDQSLTQTIWGRTFIRTYYAVSPPLARTIARSDTLREIVRRLFLKPLITLLTSERSGATRAMRKLQSNNKEQLRRD